MKKLLIIYVCCLTFLGCQKQGSTLPGTNVPPIQNASLTKIKADLLKINQSVIAKSKPTRFNWGRAAFVFSSDLGGSWVGFQWGSKIGTLVGPEGTLAGGTIGAVVAGGIASYGAYSHGIAYVAPGGNTSLDQQNIYNNIANLDVNFVLLNPNNNPYDTMVGRRHNQILKSLVTYNLIGGPTNLSNMVDTNFITTNEKVFYTNQKTGLINFYNQIGKASSYTDIEIILSNSIQDSTELVIMDNLLFGLSNVNSLSDAMNLSYAYESYIMSNSSLSINEKDCLMSGISVAKYSMNFWTSVL